MALQPGQLLHERYRIVRIIKSGGMGSVYEATDTKLADSPCPVKEIHEAAQASANSEYVAGRFFEEMKALVTLDHPSIPKVRDYLQEGQVIYIVMDLIVGRSLEEEIIERRSQASPPPVDHIVMDAVRLLETLTYLHGQDPPVIHRDIKPANILRDSRSGQIKLVDFGLARSLQGTQTQTVVGTMGYCAPEQLMGKSEERSDLYSVGVTLTHLLTGQPPEMDLFEPRRPDLPGVRPGLVEIISKATQPKPADRYVTAQEMAQDLRAWLLQSAPPSAVQAGPAPLLAAAPPRPTLQVSETTTVVRRPAWMMPAAAAAALVALILAWPRTSAPPPSQALMPSAAPVSSKPVAAKPKPVSKPKVKPTQVAAPGQPAPAWQPPPRPVATLPKPKPVTLPKPKPKPAPVQVVANRVQRRVQQRVEQPTVRIRPHRDIPVEVQVSVPREVQQVRRHIPRDVPLPF
jgi:serine/threonine protein kinase